METKNCGIISVNNPNGMSKDSLYKLAVKKGMKPSEANRTNKRELCEYLGISLGKSSPRKVVSPKKIASKKVAPPKRTTPPKRVSPKKVATPKRSVKKYSRNPIESKISPAKTSQERDILDLNCLTKNSRNPNGINKPELVALAIEKGFDKNKANRSNKDVLCDFVGIGQPKTQTKTLTKTLTKTQPKKIESPKKITKYVAPKKNIINTKRTTKITKPPKILNEILGLDISQLLCTNFRHIDIKEILSEKTGFCTNVTSNLANGLLKTSATRIFSDPTMSFAEIIANSIDAYSEGDTIGKFGMGFISNLYWLVNKPRRYIIVESETTKERWRAKIYFNDGFKLDYTELDKLNEGTYSKITIGLVDLIDKERNSFYRFLKSVGKFVNIDVKINVNQAISMNKLKDTSFASIFDNNVKSDKVLYIYFNDLDFEFNNDLIERGEIIFHDFAGGISSEILFNSMLVPSSSSKVMVNKPLIYEEEIKRKDLNDTKYHPENLLGLNFKTTSPYGIVVANVVIVPINFKYYIDFPYNARVTVARDDILISTHDEIKILEYKINKILNLAIKDRTVREVISALNEYKLFTDQQIIKTVITGCIDRFLNRDDIILVPSYFKVYEYIKNKIAVVIENSPITYISEALEITFENRILTTLGNKKVVLINDLDENYTSAGTNNMLFVNTKFYEADKKNCFNKITMSNTQEYIPSKKINDNDYNFIMKEYADNFSSYTDHYEIIKNIFSAAYAFSENYDWNLDRNHTQNFYNGYLNIKNSLLDIVSNKINFVLRQIIITETSLDYLSRMYRFFTLSYPKNVIYGEDPNLFKIKDLWSHVHDLLDDIQKRTNSYKFSSSREVNTESIKEILLDINESIFELAIEIDYVLYQSNSIYENNFMLRFFTYDANSSIYIYRKYGFNECFVVILCLLKYEHKNKIKINLNKSELDFIIFELRQLCNSNDLRNIIILLSNPLLSGKGEFETKIFVPMEIIFDYLSEKDITSTITFPRILNATTFYLTSMIDYVTQHNVDLQNLSWLKNISSTPKKIESNIIDIACNTGTTKDIVPAILTELIQNSRDAILKSNSKRIITISIDEYDEDFESDSSENIYEFKKYFVLSVKDEVGIPTSAFAALLIPFLSNKKVEGNHIPVGSMGTGFFNVFRQPLSERVIIKTTPPGTKETFIIECWPVIEKNKIVDIEYNFSVAPFEQGTTINIFCREDIRLDAGIFIKNIMSTIDIPILYNNKLIHREISFSYKEDNFNIHILENNKLRVSNIQVGGIPVIKLTDFKNEEMNKLIKDYPIIHNIVVDLSPSINVLPNQSRNRLIIENDNINKLIFSAICDANYLFTLIRLDPTSEKNKWELNNEIFGFGSASSYQQVLPSKTKNYFSNYNFGHRNYSIVSIIHEIAKMIGNNDINSTVKNFLDSNKYELFDKEKSLITVWFSNKKQKDDSFYVGYENHNKTIPRVFQIKGLTIFVEKFWEIGFKLQNSGYFEGDIFKFSNNAPKIYVSNQMDENTLGEYSRIKHNIELNEYHHEFLEKDFENLSKLTASDKLSYIKNNMKYIFKISNIATTLIHEISHAWKRQDEGFHDKSIITINKISEECEFDRAACLVYNHIVQFGLFEELLKKL